MAKRILGIAAVLFTLAGVSALAQRVPSQELVSALRTVRHLNDSSFQQLVWWAPSPTDTDLTIPDWNNTEHQIMQLKNKDRDAVLHWLTGHGRNALYERGASDAMIGRRRPAAD